MSTLTQQDTFLPPAAPAAGPRSFARAHALPLFFGLAYIFSWLIWVPLALNQLGWVRLGLDEGLIQIVRLFGTLGPALAATVVAMWMGGARGVGALWGQLGRWRVRWVWYAAAMLVLPALLLAAAGLYRLLPGVEPLPPADTSVGNLALIMVIMAISVTGEEVGWRGMALPLMLGRWPALRAGLLMGVLWTAWHLPFWIVLDQLARFGWGYWLINLVFISSISVYLTWVMVNTGNNVLLAVLAHWTFNVVSAALLVTSVVPAYVIFAGLAAAAAVVVGARLQAKPK